MDFPLICPECGLEHAEPADARLGYRVRCLACSIAIEDQSEYQALPERLAA